MRRSRSNSRVTPRNAPAPHTTLAQAREELQQAQEAERHYRLALHSDPSNRIAGLLPGRLRMQAGRHGEVESLLALVEVCRGAAFDGIDNVGAMDSVVTNNNGPTGLLSNTAGTG